MVLVPNPTSNDLLFRLASKYLKIAAAVPDDEQTGVAIHLDQNQLDCACVDTACSCQACQ